MEKQCGETAVKKYQKSYMAPTDNKHMRGQMWTMDFTMSIVALTFMILIFMLMWNTIARQWNAAGAHTKMETSAFFAAESLLATPGEPEGWEMLPSIEENISAIGLVNGRNELNPIKLQRLVAENTTGYQIIKARLGLQLYEFGMKVTDLAGNEEYYEFGRFAPKNQNNSLNFDRLGVLDGMPVIVHMEVWGQ